MSDQIQVILGDGTIISGNTMEEVIEATDAYMQENGPVELLTQVESAPQEDKSMYPDPY
jgi:hypothetical protein